MDIRAKRKGTEKVGYLFFVLLDRGTREGMSGLERFSRVSDYFILSYIKKGPRIN